MNDNFLERKNKMNEFMIGSGFIKENNRKKYSCKNFFKVFNYIYER